MPAFLSGYSYRKAVTIDNAFVDSDLTNFPALIKIAGDTDIGGRAASGGGNLRFTASDGTTLLNYERQSFSISTGAATGIFWVQVPTVTTAATTTIYVYYDNSGASDGQNRSAAWDSNFKMVQHLEQDPSGSAPQMTDSTSNSRNGTSANMTSGNLVSAKIGSGISFGATNQKLTFGTTSIPTSAGTISLRFNPTWAYNDGADHYLFYQDNASGDFFEIRKYADSNLYAGWANHLIGGRISTSASGIVQNAWNQLEMTWDSGANFTKLYLNGSLLASNIAATSMLTSQLNLGNNGSNTDLRGVLDEFRLSDTVRSDAWRKFEYRNIFETDNEISFGAEEAAAGNRRRRALISVAA